MITFQVKQHAFGRDRLDIAINKANRSSLMRAGAFVRTAARRSIKPATKARKGQRRRTTSRPGQPPRQHTTASRNLRLILFAWDAPKKTVVVGPQLFKSAGGVRIPQALEYGGRSYVQTRSRRKRATKVAARPFMRPALASEAPKFPNLFANSVKT